MQEALEFFLEYYREHYLDYTTLYPGVREALDRLRDAGKRMAVLTNKPVRISRAILDGLGVGGHFFQVYGGNSFDLKKPNPIGVETLMRETGIPRRSYAHDRRQQRGHTDGAQRRHRVLRRDLRVRSRRRWPTRRPTAWWTAWKNWPTGCSAPTEKNESSSRRHRACHRHLLVQRLQDAAAFHRRTGVPALSQHVRARTMGTGGGAERARRIER